MNDGFREGYEKGRGEKKPDTQAVADAKRYLEHANLSNSERSSLAGWLIGEVFRSSVEPLIRHRPPDE